MKTISAKQIVFFIVALNVFLFVFYAETVVQLIDSWLISYGYSHGILLFPLALGIYFYELYKNPKLNLKYINVYSILSLLFLITVWFLADALSIQVIEFVAFYLMLMITNAVLTVSNLRKLAHLWPLLLIVFTLPLWERISEILRFIETPMVVLALNASFIDAVQDGFLIHIPAGTFLVENGCSGFNQFIVSTPLAALYLYTRNISFARGYKFILTLLFLAVIFNVLRIYIIVVAGQLTHMKSSLITDHEYLAWLIYGIGVFIFFYWADKKQPNSRKESEPAEMDGKPDSTEVAVRFELSSQLKPVIILVVTLLAGPMLALAYSGYKNDTLLDVQRLEDRLFWKKTDELVRLVPAFDKGDVVYSANLSNIFGQTVDLYINYFVNQRQGHEAVAGGYSIVNEENGSVILLRPDTVELSPSVKIAVNESVVKLKSGETYVVWQWYFTNGQHVVAAMDARYNNLKGILKNMPQISNVIVSKKLVGDIAQTRKILSLFLRENLSVLEQSLNLE